jgi:integrase/recombinase XerD
MANRTSTLVLNANLPGVGWRRGTLVKSRNGRYKPNVLLYNGREFEVTNGVYQIRRYVGSKAQYVSVGTDLDAAESMLLRLEATRLKEQAERTLGIAPAPKEAEERKTLVQLVNEYIDKKKSPSLGLTRSSIHLYETTLRTFVAAVKRQFATDVTEADITRFTDHLKTQGFSQKTRSMKYTLVRGFLRRQGVKVDELIEDAVHKQLKKKPDIHTDPYTDAELEKLFAVASPYYRMVFTLLLQTGMRFREASHLVWTNVKWDENKIFIPGEQRITNKGKAKEFQTKTRKSRLIPMFGSLKAALQEWRQQNPDTVYVVGSLRGDQPNNHWLEYLKKFWKKAGLNCGTCDSCNGRGECEKAYLHRFRHTYAHRCLKKGMGIHKLKDAMGHHDISITAVYLSGATEDGADPFADAA